MGAKPCKIEIVLIKCAGYDLGYKSGVVSKDLPEDYQSKHEEGTEEYEREIKCNETIWAREDALKFKSSIYKCEEKLAKEREVNIELNYTTTGDTCTKKEALDLIDKACEKDPGKLIIYYTGYGCRDSGNWALTDDNIDLGDIVQTIKKASGKVGKLYLVSDCPFAGYWLDDLHYNLKTINKLTEYGTFSITTSCLKE